MKKTLLSVSSIALVSCSAPEKLTRDQATQAETVIDVFDVPTVPTDTVDICAPQTAVTPFCGFQSPEDAEWLPDGSGLIVSEYGQYVLEGRISLVNLETGAITVLHDANIGMARPAANEWGADGVKQKEKFSPHGISLAQRDDGRWQLLVVNHAEIETIDFFELMDTDGVWTLHWRGGVDAEDDSKFNDVAAAGNGFFTTRFFRGTRDELAIDYYEGRENGIVKQWSPEAGWADLVGTEGVALNGILWNEEADELVVSEWGKSRVNVFSGTGERKYSVAHVSHPDNVSWNEDRDAYLVASKSIPVEKLVECGAAGAEVCEGEFHIYEITPETGEKKVRYQSDGTFWGPPSNAVEKDGKLYIGSFGGTRILVTE